MTSNPKNETFAGPESDAAIQKGYLPERTFYNDVSSDSFFNLGGFNNTVNNFVEAGRGFFNTARTFDWQIRRDFSLTQPQLILLRKRAEEISKFGNVPYEAAFDFLLILCYIDEYEILRSIADVINVPRLDSPSNVRNPDKILDIGGLNKVAFLASAVNAIVKRYSRFLNAAANTEENTAGTKSNEEIEIMSVLSSLSSFLQIPSPEQEGLNEEVPIPRTMGIGEGKEGEGNGPPYYPKYDNPPESGKEGFERRIQLGNPRFSGLSNLSKLFSGKEIPASIRANNPSEKEPSHVGKMFFGENSVPMSKIDLEEVFPKLLGVYKIPSNGAGSQSFDFQNVSGFTGISVKDAVSKVTGLSANSITSVANKLTNSIEKFKTITGAKEDEDLDLKRADNAIPFMIAISSIVSGFEKSPFSEKTFTGGWNKSLAVSNYLIRETPEFIETLRALR